MTNSYMYSAIKELNRDQYGPTMNINISDKVKPVNSDFENLVCVIQWNEVNVLHRRVQFPQSTSIYT